MNKFSYIADKVICMSSENMAVSAEEAGSQKEWRAYSVELGAEVSGEEQPGMDLQCWPLISQPGPSLLKAGLPLHVWQEPTLKSAVLGAPALLLPHSVLWEQGGGSPQPQTHTSVSSITSTLDSTVSGCGFKSPLFLLGHPTPFLGQATQSDCSRQNFLKQKHVWDTSLQNTPQRRKAGS